MHSIATDTFRPPPLSLYIHLPWCVQRCPYCDFNAHASNDFDEKAYLDALLQDVQQSLPLVWGRRIHSIFIGGGTPSLFSGQAITHLLSQLRALLPIAPHCEITLEANPNSAEQAHFKAYQQAGVNRLSIGVQSFDNQKLHALGRAHCSEEAIEAVASAKQAGFETVNIDMMFGLPEQTQPEALADLHQALALQPQHISWYQLTIEPNTQFAHQPPSLPAHKQLFAMHNAGIALLATQGFARYEVSAFAKEGKRCMHNMNYWQFGDYLGIGAGAHGKLSFPGKIIRTTKHRSPQTYMRQADKTSSSDAVAAKDLPFEFMLNALRLTEGFETSLFCAQTQLPESSLQPQLQQAIAQGYLQKDASRLVPTEKGLWFVDDMVARYLD